MFGYAISLLLIAIGAILAFAVTATVSGIALHTVGWIVLVVGLVGLVLSLIFASEFFSRDRRYPRDPRDL
jgi:hypothetical protein